MVSAESSPSILVVDDNPLITNVLTSLLTSQEYSVRVASNGQEALDCLQDGPSDLIICDVMMPQLDGYGLFQKVREVPDFAHIPFVFLTALGEQPDVMQGVESGADDYVVKPFDPKHLLSLVKGKVTRSKAIKTQTHQANDNFRKRIIHTLSHEFRTPLVAINTGTELLVEHDGPLDRDKAKSLLQAIQRGGMRLEKLVNDFMLMQQVEAGIAERLFRSRGVEASPGELVGEFLDLKKEAIADQNFEVTFEDFTNSTLCSIYTPQLHEMVWRLIENAMKFSENSRTIEVVVLNRDDSVGIEVRDRGIGMNANQLGVALDTFAQINRDKLEQQGGGLGLALVKRYAGIHGGEFTLENREGGGSVARITLPVVSSR